MKFNLLMVIYLLITKKLLEKKIDTIESVRCGKLSFDVNAYEETLPNGSKHIAVYNKDGTLQNTAKFIVPEKHFF